MRSIPKFSDDQLLMTARLYYVDGLAQADVARIMQVSQPQVSRILSLARERGIVRITVADYDPRDRTLEQQLTEEFNLKNPIVIKTVKGSRTEELRYTLAHFAAADVSSMIDNARTLAIAGGRTLQEVVEQLRAPRSHHSLHVIQAMGNIGSAPVPYDGLELGRRIALEWRGSFHMLNTPVLLPSAATRDSIMSLGENQTVATRLGQADLALVGIGTLQNSVFVERNVLNPSELEKLRKCRAVGEICGHYYDINGDECNTDLNDRVASIGLDQLRNTPMVVAITVGDDRTEALQGAIAGGIIKSVIMDDWAAEALLKSRTKAGVTT